MAEKDKLKDWSEEDVSVLKIYLSLQMLIDAINSCLLVVFHKNLMKCKGSRVFSHNEKNNNLRTQLALEGAKEHFFRVFKIDFLNFLNQLARVNLSEMQV